MFDFVMLPAPMPKNLVSTKQPKLYQPMKTKITFVVLTILSVVLFVSMSRAADITAAATGNWGDPGTWIGGVVPGTNDDADIPTGIIVTVTTNAAVQYIYDAGTVTLSPNALLTITDPTGANGTAQLGTLGATANGCTVIYACNPYWAKPCNYYNLVFDTSYFVPPTNTPPWLDFNNFSTAGNTPMTIAGDMTLVGHVKVQQGTDNQNGSCDISIGGNLIIGQGCAWDCSGANLTVVSNTYVYGKLLDGNGAIGLNSFGGNLVVLGPATPGRAYYQPPFYVGDYTNGWFVSDVTQWAIGGSLTNNGYIGGTGYGSISFNGTGTIGGSNSLVIPTMAIWGTYTVGTTITLFTNTPTLNGTLVFDIAHIHQIVLLTNAGTPLFYAGILNVINSGATPASGASYTLFQCLNGFGGAFDSTSFPGLPAGLSWVDNMLTSGSIAVTGTLLGYPTLTLSRSGANLTLSWDSATFPGYQVLALTNRSVKGTTWSSTGSGTVSPFATTINPTNPSVFYRLSNP
jgi:hypothetical protein